MWRRLFGGGSKDPQHGTQGPQDGKAKRVAREAAAGEEADVEAGVEADFESDTESDVEEIPFEDDELPDFDDEAEAAADVHAGLTRDPETGAPVATDAAGAAGAASATNPAGAAGANGTPGTALPRVQIHATGPFERHIEDVSPFEDRPVMAREEYEMLVADLPMPRKKQMREFAEYVAGAKSWHRHLSLLPAGAPFRFYLNPFCGMDRILSADGRAAFIPRGDDAARLHYSWLPTDEYRRRFGFLSFACAEASQFTMPVRVEVDDTSFDGTLDNNVNYAVLWVPQKPFHIPEAIQKAGTCMITGAVHPRAACPAAWRRTLDAVKSNHAWPLESGGPATLARIRERVAAAGAGDEIDPELQELLAPERRRLLDEMVAAMTRMVEQLHGAL